jgi:ADP-ribose pyrophosphatase
MSKIPAHATRVFKGIVYDVWQWEQVLYDGSTTTFEMLKRPDTVIVIALQGDKVYYAKQEQPNKPPFLSLFGGRAEIGEEPLTAAKRELLEETGFTSADWEQIRCFKSPGKIEWHVYFFIARNCQKTGEQKLDSGEKIEILSASIDTFINTIILDPNFSEYELRNELLSAFNPSKAESLKQEIIGKAG